MTRTDPSQAPSETLRSPASGTSVPGTSAPGTSEDAVISAVGVRRHFGKVRAVDGVDLTVPRGEVLALLGPNGAGKTTFLDMVLGFSRPDSGTLRVFGREPRAAVEDGRVGAVLQTGGLLDDLTVQDQVAFVADCHRSHLPVADVMARADLSGLARRRVRKCSGGERQRIRFALALLSDPELLVLDEPTAGMDVASRAAFWATMHAEAERGRTVVFATHYLAEAAEFADRVVLLRGGRVHADGTVHELTADAPRTLECTWSSATAPEDVAASQGLPDAGVSRTGDRVTITFTGGPEDSDRLVAAVLTQGVGRDVSVQQASLDRLFLDLTASGAESAAPASH